MIVELDLLTAELNIWYETTPAKAINVVSVPYRGIEPLTGFLAKALGPARLLYVSNEPQAMTDWLQSRGLTVAFREDPASDAVILGPEAAFHCAGAYDLVVCDDLCAFPGQRRTLIQELLTHLYKRGDRIIAYAMEPLFQKVKTLELPLKQDRSFVTEPRFLDLKTDIRTSIPSSLYEYIDFFFNDGRPAVIFVPDEATGEGIRSYLTRINPALKEHMVVIDGLTDEAVAQQLAQGAAILFSQQLRDLRGIPKNFEFIVIHSEQARHEYRQFVFLCLRSGLYDEVNGEVILLAPVVTHDMDRTKQLTQDFNRVIWENDQLAP